MAKESTLSKNTRRVLKKAGFRACRVENPCEPGFPDLAFATPDNFLGLCELKQRQQPKRAETPVRLELRPAQRAFLHTWQSATFILIQIGVYYVLLDHDPVDYPMERLLSASLWHTDTLSNFKSDFPCALRRASARVYTDAVSALPNAT